MPLRAASHPSFAGKLVVLADDPRLCGVPARVPADQTRTVPADEQVIAFVPITLDGTLVLNGILVMI